MGSDLCNCDRGFCPALPPEPAVHQAGSKLHRKKFVLDKQLKLCFRKKRE